MPSAPNDLLISIPFAEPAQSVFSPRYDWDNSRRGKESFVILQWTFQGAGCFEFEGRERSVGAGEAFIAIPPEASRYYFSRRGREPWKFAWVNFYGALGVSLLRKLREAFGPVLPLPAESAAGVMALRLAGMARKGEFADPHEASAACYGFLMEWMRQLTRPMFMSGNPVEAAIGLCAARFREPLGIKELAAQTGLSREHFTRLFTERVGKPPARYLRDLRVGAALQMLRRRGTPLKEIALRCGFPSVRSMRRGLPASAATLTRRR